MKVRMSSCTTFCGQINNFVEFSILSSSFRILSVWSNPVHGFAVRDFFRPEGSEGFKVQFFQIWACFGLFIGVRSSILVDEPGIECVQSSTCQF